MAAALTMAPPALASGYVKNRWAPSVLLDCNTVNCVPLPALIGVDWTLPEDYLLAGTGGWNSSSPLTYSFHWAVCTGRDAQGCQQLGGGFGALSPQVPDDLDEYMTVIVTATNTTGQSAQANASQEIITIPY